MEHKRAKVLAAARSFYFDDDHGEVNDDDVNAVRILVKPTALGRESSVDVFLRKAKADSDHQLEGEIASIGQQQDHNERQLVAKQRGRLVEKWTQVHPRHRFYHEYMLLAHGDLWAVE